MRRRSDVIIRILTLLVLWVSPLPLFAQAPKPPSLKEQLEAQYLQPGTVLTIKQAGILGVSATSKTPCVTKYRGGKLNADASCTASKPLTVGEKVNLLKIEVDEGKGKISFRIGECDSCNDAKFSSLASQIDFQFADLKKASVSAVEGTIEEVLTIDEGGEQPPQKAQGSKEHQGEQTTGVLTNNDIVKMARVKLGDGIIISKIKSSPSNFDMSVDALVKLKEASVSDPVIQAMQDAQQATIAAANNPPTDEPAPTGSSAESAAVWLGFANETASQDREAELHQNCGADFRRVYVPRDAGNKFTDLCSQEGRTCETVCDWEGHNFPCSAVSRGGRRDGTRIALCRSASSHQVNDQNAATDATAGSATVPGQVSFPVRHRHGAFFRNLGNTDAPNEYYCSGTLSVSADGTVAYDCAQTDDPSGRCEHLSFAPGALKQAKMGFTGNLHLESKTKDKLDFYGNRNDIQQALAAITPLIQTTQK